MTIQIRKDTVLAALIPTIILGTLLGLTLFSDTANAQQNLVPTWIKNVAQFWSNDDITDQEFVNAMEYLVGEGVMEIPNYVTVAEAQEMTRNLGEQGIIIVDTLVGMEERGIIIVDTLVGMEEQGIIIVDTLVGMEERGIIIVGTLGGLEAQGIIIVDTMEALTGNLANLQADVAEIKNLLTAPATGFSG